MAPEEEKIMTIDPKILAAAFLWLRNHYDIGDCTIKSEVLDRCDRIIKDTDIRTNDMSKMRKAYPFREPRKQDD
jgi:hypothetical protein